MILYSLNECGIIAVCHYYSADNAIAFVFDGLYYGVSDFGYAAYSTVLFLSPLLVLLVITPTFSS